MDSIDIIDPTFSLDVPKLNEMISDNDLNGTTDDHSIYIYVGITLLVVMVGIFVYNKFTEFHQNKMGEENKEDCPGGFCTMNHPNRQI
jgi:hypothetical protein